MKNKILWISTGGTFSCIETKNGLSPASDNEFMKKIVEDNKEIKNFADITFSGLFNIDSTEMDFDKIKAIANEINKEINNYDGILITHGTDTMAYTCALLSVMIENPPVPIVLTGSQKPYFCENTDAKKNFKNAIYALCNKKLICVCVVFDKSIFYGLDCTKSSSTDIDAFSAYDKPLGVIENGKAEILNEDIIKKGEYKFFPDICDKVALIKLNPFFDESIIDCYIKKGIKGFVIEGYGVGGIPGKVIEKLEKAKDNNIFSMLISQCKNGGTDLSIYEVGKNASLAGIADGKKLGVEGALALMMKNISNKQFS